MNNYPIFDNHSLNDFVSSIKARSKSLKSKYYYINIEKVIEGVEGFDAKAELTLRKSRSHKSITVRLNVWPDRWVWVDAREASDKGWLWSFNEEGRLAGGKNWSDVIRCAEAMAEIFTAGVDNGAKKAGEIWRKTLVKGPVGEARKVRL